MRLPGRAAGIPAPDTSLDAYEKMIRTIEENVDTREYQVLVKPHQIVYYHIKDTVGITGQYIPANRRYQ